LVNLYNEPDVQRNLVFRGGTALNKEILRNLRNEQESTAGKKP
jgi:predicted nucleotidyltransferase component of viral defense system